MQPKSLKLFHELACGDFSMSLGEIVKYQGEYPIPCGVDIYQGSNDPKKSPQILIKAGVDLKKRQKPLKKFYDNALKKDNSDCTFLASESGQQLEEIKITINADSMPYFVSAAEPFLEKLLKFIDTSELTANLHIGQLSLYSKVKKIFTNLMKAQNPTFYLYAMDDSDLLETYHNAIVAFYSVYIAQIMHPGAEWISTLFEAAFFHELGLKPKKDSTGDKAKNRGLAMTEDILEKLQPIAISKSSLALIKSHHKLLVIKDKKGGIAAKILQTVNALDSYSRGGFVAIHDKIEICTGTNIDKCCETLMLKSNPQINDNCPAPIFEETIVNAILNLLGRNYLIEKERQIRNEILEPCEYTNCQAISITENIASVADKVEILTWSMKQVRALIYQNVIMAVIE
ncbi:hypothetical protein MJH12_08590 [bacterium]|nr:hypothetical protein [bacterium]